MKGLHHLPYRFLARPLLQRRRHLPSLHELALTHLYLHNQPSAMARRNVESRLLRASKQTRNNDLLPLRRVLFSPRLSGPSHQQHL